MIDTGTTECLNFIPSITTNPNHNEKVTKIMLEFDDDNGEKGYMVLDEAILASLDWTQCFNKPDDKPDKYGNYALTIAGDIIFAMYGAIAFENTTPATPCPPRKDVNMVGKVCSKGNLYFYPKNNVL